MLQDKLQEMLHYATDLCEPQCRVLHRFALLPTRTVYTVFRATPKQRMRVLPCEE